MSSAPDAPFASGEAWRSSRLGSVSTEGSRLVSGMSAKVEVDVIRGVFGDLLNGQNVVMSESTERGWTYLYSNKVARLLRRLWADF